jgi:cytoskeletal protein RodZ
MTIEGLGKKFQEARLARNLTLDEAARMTKIRPARLAEIEADDFSQFPSLAYAKGFLLIYGKFLDVDVTPYLDAFEDSERVTVDGYSYLQENRPQKAVAAPVVRRRRPATPTTHDRISPMPLIFGVLVLVIGFSVMKLILNVQRLAPGKGQSTAQVSPSASPVPSPKAGQPGATEASAGTVASAPTVAPPALSEAATSPVATAGPPEIRKALAASAAASEPEVRRAKPVTREEGTPPETTNSSSAESGEQNRVAIRPLKRTYVKVTVGDKSGSPAFERWVSPADGPVEFRGKHVSIRVLDPDAVQITKNGKALEDDDEDVTVN